MAKYFLVESSADLQHKMCLILKNFDLESLLEPHHLRLEEHQGLEARVLRVVKSQLG